MAQGDVGLTYSYPGLQYVFPALPRALSEGVEQLKGLNAACKKAETLARSMVPKVQQALDEALDCAFKVGDKVEGLFAGACSHDWVKCTLVRTDASSFYVKYSETKPGAKHVGVKEGDEQALSKARVTSGSKFKVGTFRRLRRGQAQPGNKPRTLHTKVDTLREHIKVLEAGELPRHDPQRLAWRKGVRGAGGPPPPGRAALPADDQASH